MPPLPETPLSVVEAQFLGDARTGHLSTASSGGKPHVVPICFVFDGHAVYSVLDQKPKTVELLRLRRVRNILENPQVSLVVDYYEEDWSNLRFILVSGRAELLTCGEERNRAVVLLREKYDQYRRMELEASPVIKITPENFSSWNF